MAEDAGEASRVVKEVEEWFARVPFETLREEFLAAPDWETAARRMTELGYEIPDLIDPGVEIPAEGIAGLRDEAGFVGWDGWVRFWAAWFEPWEGYEWETTNWEEIGDHVVLDGLNRARGRESGAPVEWWNTQVWTVRGGKIVRVVGYGTREEALAALRPE
jgi:hypothetical protein